MESTYVPLVDSRRVARDTRRVATRKPARAKPRPRGPLSPARFRRLLRALGASRDSSAFARLRAAYAEPHRAYHTAEHVAACLRLFDEPDVKACATHPDEVEAALWFHDAVYDTHASDNEAKSAAMASEALADAGVAAEVVARIAGHVRATQHHDAATADGALVVDIDLSILGADTATFARFDDAIRREYAWVDDAAFEEGRRAVLRRFAERPKLYVTPLLRDRFEARARKNLAWRLAPYRVLETVDDDGAFHRETTFTVLGGPIGKALLTFTGSLEDSMFADQKVYSGVRWVELDPDGVHLRVHGYQGPFERVPIPGALASVCPECGGTGQVPDSLDNYVYDPYGMAPCPSCTKR
jgi:predicted metal-dependent HD superfamily phosphohydrolase